MAIKMRGYGFDTVGRCVLTLLRVLSYLHSGADTLHLLFCHSRAAFFTRL